MDLGVALDLGREALFAALVIAGPILAAGLIVGLIISLLQTLTQLQDQTVSIVPKIIAMMLATMIFIPWLAGRMIEFTQKMFTLL